MLWAACIHLFFSFVFLKTVNPESTKSNSDDEEQQMELDEEMENEICRVWDMSMDEVWGWKRNRKDCWVRRWWMDFFKKVQSLSLWRKTLASVSFLSIVQGMRSQEL